MKGPMSNNTSFISCSTDLNPMARAYRLSSLKERRYRTGGRVSFFITSSARRKVSLWRARYLLLNQGVNLRTRKSKPRAITLMRSPGLLPLAKRIKNAAVAARAPIARKVIQSSSHVKPGSDGNLFPDAELFRVLSSILGPNSCISSEPQFTELEAV